MANTPPTRPQSPPISCTTCATASDDFFGAALVAAAVGDPELAAPEPGATVPAAAAALVVSSFPLPLALALPPPLPLVVPVAGGTLWDTTSAVVPDAAAARPTHVPSLRPTSPGWQQK